MVIPHILIVVSSISAVFNDCLGFYHSGTALVLAVDLGFLPPCLALVKKPCRPYDHLRGAFLKRPLFSVVEFTPPGGYCLQPYDVILGRISPEMNDMATSMLKAC